MRGKYEGKTCLYYGQPRFTNNPYCYESHKKFIFDRYDTDVYAHLWWDEDEDYDRSHVTDWEFSTWLQMEKCPKDREDLDPDLLTSGTHSS